MVQFCVYRNPNPGSREHIPYLLDVQTDLLEHLHTCVVVPLVVSSRLRGKAARVLNPVFIIEAQEVVMLTPELAGIHRRLLGEPVTSLEKERVKIIAALDFLVTGV